MYEINGNLDDANDGLENYSLFAKTIATVWNYYKLYVDNEVMDSLDLYIDNAAQDSKSGYTPVITPIFRKYLTIKLNINSLDHEGKVAYQFSHELMHFVFYTKYGIHKKRADEREESICSAASLCILHHLYPAYFEIYNEHVKHLVNDAYRKGVEIAQGVKYSLEELLKLI